MVETIVVMQNWALIVLGVSSVIAQIAQVILAIKK